MGINGLLPNLKSISKPVHIREYSGCTVAVDGYSWLHKGAYGCSRELCEGVWTDKFVSYCMSRVELLKANGVEPIIVFDGGRLPLKSDEEDSRRRSRGENREKALAHVAAGNMTAALECFQRAVSISPVMAKQLIECLKERGISFLVAPYEADAQMAYLALSGEVHAVITEDSDMLCYGCPRVIYKLDKFGNGEEIRLEDLGLNRTLSFVGFTHEMFVAMCVLSGCDFLPNLPGIGVKKAHNQMKKFRCFVRAIKAMRFNGMSIPSDYEARVQQALWVFRHQRVFCRRTRTLRHLNTLPSGGLGAADVDVIGAVPEGQDAVALNFLGPILADDIAAAIACGDIHPSTHEAFDLAEVFKGCPYIHRYVKQPDGPEPQISGPSKGPTSGSANPRCPGLRPPLAPRQSQGRFGTQPSKPIVPARNGITKYLTKTAPVPEANVQGAPAPTVSADKETANLNRSRSSQPALQSHAATGLIDPDRQPSAALRCQAATAGFTSPPDAPLSGASRQHSGQSETRSSGTQSGTRGLGAGKLIPMEPEAEHAQATEKPAKRARVSGSVDPSETPFSVYIPTQHFSSRQPMTRVSQREPNELQADAPIASSMHQQAVGATRNGQCNIQPTYQRGAALSHQLSDSESPLNPEPNDSLPGRYSLSLGISITNDGSCSLDLRVVSDGSYNDQSGLVNAGSEREPYEPWSGAMSGPGVTWSEGGSWYTASQGLLPSQGGPLSGNSGLCQPALSALAALDNLSQDSWRKIPQSGGLEGSLSLSLPLQSNELLSHATPAWPSLTAPTTFLKTRNISDEDEDDGGEAEVLSPDRSKGFLGQLRANAGGTGTSWGSNAAPRAGLRRRTYPFHNQDQDASTRLTSRFFSTAAAKPQLTEHSCDLSLGREHGRQELLTQEGLRRALSRSEGEPEHNDWIHDEADPQRNRGTGSAVDDTQRVRSMLLGVDPDSQDLLLDHVVDIEASGLELGMPDQIETSQQHMATRSRQRFNPPVLNQLHGTRGYRQHSADSSGDLDPLLEDVVLGVHPRERSDRIGTLEPDLVAAEDIAIAADFQGQTQELDLAISPQHVRDISTGLRGQNNKRRLELPPRLVAQGRLEQRRRASEPWSKEHIDSAAQAMDSDLIDLTTVPDQEESDADVDHDAAGPSMNGSEEVGREVDHSDFHSIEHVAAYAKLARQSMDRVERGVISAFACRSGGSGLKRPRNAGQQTVMAAGKAGKGSAPAPQPHGFKAPRVEASAKACGKEQRKITDFRKYAFR